MKTLIREAKVAGRFYPETPDEMDRLFDRLIDRERDLINYDLSRRRIIGAVLPHAGIMYSGYQAIHFFEILSRSNQKFDTFVILHPIHRGGSMAYATDQCEGWKTPFGEVHLDNEFISAMNLPRSAEIHEQEHSAEVILPFLQKYLRHSFRIVPIGIIEQNPVISEEIAQKIAEATDKTGRKICILSSCDFSHYVNPEEGIFLDKKVTDKIIKLDPKGMFDIILENNISVCGYGPVMSLMYFSLMNYSGVEAEIIARGNSGEVHPAESVVDYISILFHTSN